MLLFFCLKVLFIDEKPPKVTIGGEETISSLESSKIQIFSSMHDLIITEGVIYIGAGAFTRANSLTSVIFPDSLKIIYNGAFQYCYKLETAHFGQGLQSIEFGAFDSTILSQELIVPENFVKFDQFSMAICQFKKITFNNKVMCQVYPYAFYTIPDIIVDFQNAPVTLDTFSFYHSSISQIHIGPNVVLNGNPFTGEYLLTITVDSQNTRYLIDKGALTDSPPNTIICFPSKMTGSYEISAGISAIGPKAFYMCSLSSLDCSSIKIIEIEGFQFSGRFLTILRFPSITTIKDGGFISSGVKELFFGDSLRTIGTNAFSTCVNLTSINLPNSIESVGQGILGGCSSLESVSISNDHPLIVKGSNNILYTRTYTSYVFIPSTITTLNIPSTIEFSENGFRGLKNLKTVVFNFGYTSFPKSLFAECTGLEFFQIPASVNYLGYDAFFGCSGLKKLEFLGPECGVGQNTFKDCISLEEIIWPNTLRLEAWAFQSCISLKSLTLPPNSGLIQERAFLFCGNIELVTIRSPNFFSDGSPFDCCPKLKKVIIDSNKITDHCFEGLGGLETVVFGSNIENIGLSSFFSCSKLISVEWENIKTSKLKLIGNNGFSRCNSLERIELPKLVEDLTASIFTESRKLTWIEVDSESILFKSVEGIVYDINEKILIVCPTGLEMIETLDTTEGLGKYAFAGCFLKEIILSSRLSKINEFCFINCMYLKNVNIPLNINYIGESPFKGCASLKNIFYCGTSDSGMSSYENKDQFPENTNFWVSTKYLANTFMNHQVQKSSSIDKNNCPNVPTHLFTNKKKRRNSKLSNFISMSLLFSPKFV